MLKIILADNQAIFRTGAAKVLAVEDDVRIVAQAESTEKMNMALEKFHATLLIFSAEMTSDLPAVVEAARKNKTKLVAVAETGQDSRHYLTNGVNGVIYRNVSGEALVQCIRKVNKGETWVQDTVIVQGYKNKEIASQLGTTEQVIKNYLRNVYDKIGVSDRLELALFTIHHRILAEAAATSVAPTSPR